MLKFDFWETRTLSLVNNICSIRETVGTQHGASSRWNQSKATVVAVNCYFSTFCVIVVRVQVSLLRLAQKLMGRPTAPGPGTDLLRLFAARVDEAAGGSDKATAAQRDEVIGGDAARARPNRDLRP